MACAKFNTQNVTWLSSYVGNFTLINKQIIYLSVYFPTFAEPQFLLKQNSSAVQLTNCPPRPKFVNREPLKFVKRDDGLKNVKNLHT